ncbi:MAG TPA: DUF2892 domain-containing protein [Acidobacteriota bacterium]|nr:DUF2892 domain-containing protein [Acidobacteriota bacterium]
MNVGIWDRIIRIIVAAALIVIGFLLFADWWRWVFIVVGAIIGFTSLIGWCALYAVFGINTCVPKAARAPEKRDTP